MLLALKIIAAILSVILIALILIQPGNAGLSLTSMTQTGGKFEKRGAEKTLHKSTIVIGALYIIVAVAYFLMA